ncbi:RadC family protein [Caryophanon latum]|uniref:RadC family protein n=1 Tax=Caryophanon latum TaxID=33977 RepID=UPI000ABDA863|nr:DNA repair protein RadC [Caryophanon latum]
MHIRPQERFLAYGAAALTNEELLALILRSGTKEATVTNVASELMHKFERVQHLKEATLQELMAIRGIGQMKALQLLAAIELGKRISSKMDMTRYSIRSPADAAEYVMEELSGLQQEHFLVLYLNTKNEVMHKETVFIGSLNASIVHPREIVRP